MSDFTDEQVNAVWAKGFVAPGYDETKYRFDVAGAMMIRDRYGKEDEFGWEIDHVFPKARLEKMKILEDEWDIPLNLQPLNKKNNASKSDDYPEYTVCREYDFSTNKNKEVMKKLAVDPSKESVLSVLFKVKRVIVGRG